MEFYLFRANQQDGPFSAQVIRERLTRGELAPSDLCFSQAMTAWTPISQVAELVPPAPPTPLGAPPFLPPPPPAAPMPKAGLWQTLVEKLGITARLTHKQALRKKLELSDLHNADYRTGLQAYEKRLAPAACAAIVAQVDDVARQIANLEAEAPAPPAEAKTFAGTAKAVAHATSNAAKIQSLRSQQGRLVRQLGEKIRQSSPPVPELTHEVSAANEVLNHMQALDGEIAALASQTYPWARQPLLILGLLAVLVLGGVGWTWLRGGFGPAPALVPDGMAQAQAYFNQVHADQNKYLADQQARIMAAQQQTAAQQAADEEARKKALAASAATLDQIRARVDADQAKRLADADAASAQIKAKADAEAKANQDAIDQQAAAAKKAADALRPGVLWPGHANTADFVNVSKELWNLATNQRLSTNWCGKGQVILNNDDLIFSHSGSPSWGIADAAFTADPTQQPTSGYAYSGPQNTQPVAGLVMAKDYRRVAYIEKGDVWRGEYDWQQQTVINKKQITQLGVLDGKHILLWYGNTLLIDAKLSPDKPIVRIDLGTGQTQEIPTVNAITVGMNINRGGYLIYRPSCDVIYTYDVRTGEARTIPNSVRMYHGKHWSDNWIITAFSDNSVRWVSDDEALVTISDQYIYNHHGIVKLNLKTGRQQLLQAYDYPADINSLLPDGRTAEVGPSLNDSPQNLPAAQQQLYLLDFNTGAQTPLPMSYTMPHAWLDANRCLFGKPIGDLDQLGTWLYDRTTNQTTHVSSRIFAIDQTPHFLADGVTYFFATNGSPHLFRAKIGGGQPEELSCPIHAEPINGTPIDLGFGNPPSPLWQPPVYSPEQQQADAPASPPTGPDYPGNLFTLLDSLKDAPPATRANATNLYNYCLSSPELVDCYDPAKFALTMLAAVQKNPNAQLGGLVQQIDLSSCISLPVTENTTYRCAMKALSERHLWSEQQREAIASAAAARFIQLVATHPNFLSNTRAFQDAMLAAAINTTKAK